MNPFKDTPSKPSLKELQKTLRYYLTDARGIEAAIRDDAAPEGFTNPRSRPKSPPTRFVKEQKPLKVEDRLGIYADAYFLRLRDVLMGDFEILRAYLGDERIEILVKNFLGRTHSKTPMVDLLCRDFTEWLTQQNHLVDELTVEIAHYEWLRLKALFCPLPRKISQEKLAWLSNPEVLGEIYFILSSGFGFFKSTHNFGGFDETTDKTAAENLNKLKTKLADQVNDQCGIAILRNEDGLFCESLDTKSYKLISFIAQGLTLEEICNKLLESDEDPTSFMSMIGSYLESGFIDDFIR